MTSRKVDFRNAEGHLLSGVLELPEGQARGWGVFAHCFACSKTSLAATRVSRGLAMHGIGTLRFDFAGLGASEGDFSDTAFSSTTEDLVSAVHWMGREGRPVGLLVGHSLGGAAVIVAAGKLPEIKAVATLGAPADAEHVAHQFSAHIPEIEATGEAQVQLGERTFTVRKQFLDDIRAANIEEAATRLKRPILVLHAPMDDVVGIDNATGIFKAARHPKSFVSLDGADHFLSDKTDADFVASMIVAWSQRYLGEGAAPEIADAEAPGAQVVVRETRQSGQFQNEVFAAGQRWLADEPTDVGGTGTGPDPYQLVNAGLGACTSMTLRMYADRKGWPLARVSVTLDHSRRHAHDCVDCGPGDKVDVFARAIEIEGDLDETQRAKLLEIADKCPVHRTLTAGSQVETRVVTNSAK